jgi:hypothetical protein
MEGNEDSLSAICPVMKNIPFKEYLSKRNSIFSKDLIEIGFIKSSISKVRITKPTYKE